MFVESKPVSTYGETEGWRMPSPQPSGALKRPPIVKTSSSSSSLGGMEQAVPSFQSFLRRTPTPDQHKPLPPTPLRPRRPSSFDSASSRPSSRFTRRSSSVYSRTISQWGPEPDVPAIPSWQTADFAEQNLLLRPIAYSASTSQLLGQKSTQGELLQPRAYSPLINTPSPTISRRTTPSPPPEPKSSMLLPPPAGVLHVPKKHLRTVSLEKAKEMIQAPGAVHLLPEELRAQTLGKSRSQEPLRITSMDIMAGRMTPPELPEAPTLVDHQGRERLLSLPRASTSPITPLDYPFSSIASPVEAFPSAFHVGNDPARTMAPPVAPKPGTTSEYPSPTLVSPTQESQGAFHVGSGPMKTMAPLASQTRTQSREKAAQALGLADADETRGRPRTRGPRNMSYDHYLPGQKRKSDDSNDSDDLQSDAQKIAQEYHSLLSEQYRQASASPASQTSGSDLDVRTHMKMVPQPLFHARPAARTSDNLVGRGSVGSVSPFGRAGNGVAGNDDRLRSGSGSSFPLRLDSTESMHRRRSTSGSIPISPPSASVPSTPSPSRTAPAILAKQQKLKPRQGSDDNRVSAYYPHVMSRKKGKGKQSSGTSSSQAPPVPMLAADIIAERLKTPESTPDGSPLRNFASHSDLASLHSQKSNRPLHKRVLKSAVKYADILTRPAESPSRGRSRDEQSPMGKVASPESPHLLPSPASSNAPPAMHLGWSDHAKSSFDRARSSIQSPKHHPETLFEHVQTPARPLDDSRAGLREPDSPGRKGSIFGGLMESWRESKADKRREELKKIIKVVTPDQVEEESRPSLLARRLSSYGWM